MPFEHLKLETEGRIGWIFFNRPEKLNALNNSVYLELERALAAWQNDDAISAVVLCGGERTFIAGVDIDGMVDAGPVEAHELTDISRRAQERLCNLPKPTVAAISGYALGGGLEVALCCDFRLAAENAILGLPEITLGIIPGAGGTQRLPRVVGQAAATEMIFLGRPVKAAKALEMGLVHRVVALDQLRARAQELAEELASRPAMALRAAKAALRAAGSTSLQEGLLIEQQLFSHLFATRDQSEGMKAFLEKRKPNFQGK